MLFLALLRAPLATVLVTLPAALGRPADTTLAELAVETEDDANDYENKVCDLVPAPSTDIVRNMKNTGVIALISIRFDSDAVSDWHDSIDIDHIRLFCSSRECKRYFVELVHLAIIEGGDAIELSLNVEYGG